MRGLLLLLLTTAHARAPAPPTPPTGPITVIASFYPLADFARRIGGEHVMVEILTPPDGDPAGHRPDAAAIARLQRAELILINGANFEAWPRWVALPFNRTVDTTAAVTDQLLSYRDAIQHKHGAEGAHDHTGVDGHTWLDPQLAAAQARAIHAALVRARPQRRATFDANHARLAADLAELQRRLAAVPGAPRLANHPAYNYLARRFGWTLASFDLDPDAAPDAPTLARVRDATQRSGAATLLWESQPAPAVARAYAQIGLRSVVFSPVERAPADGDFVAAMRANIERLGP